MLSILFIFLNIYKQSRGHSSVVTGFIYIDKKVPFRVMLLKKILKLTRIELPSLGFEVRTLYVFTEVCTIIPQR